MTDLLPDVQNIELPADPLLVIEVTEENIYEGAPGLSDSCAIAMSLSGRGFRSVEVSATDANWWDGEYYWAELPLEAQDFISSYDAWGETPHDEYCDDEDCEGCGENAGAPAPITFSIEVRAGHSPEWEQRHDPGAQAAFMQAHAKVMAQHTDLVAEVTES